MRGEDNKKQVAPALEFWKVDADLAAVRDDKALAKLPEHERQAFRKLWVAVDQLRSKANVEELACIPRLKPTHRHSIPQQRRAGKPVLDEEATSSSGVVAASNRADWTGRAGKVLSTRAAEFSDALARVVQVAGGNLLLCRLAA